MVKVLVVEDEASIREMIALNLRLAGMEAVEADSAEAALPLLEQRPGCDAAILDDVLQQKDRRQRIAGIGIIHQNRALAHDLLILFSDQADHSFE